MGRKDSPKAGEGLMVVSPLSMGYSTTQGGMSRGWREATGADGMGGLGPRTVQLIGGDGIQVKDQANV